MSYPAIPRPALEWRKYLGFQSECGNMLRRGHRNETTPTLYMRFDGFLRVQRVAFLSLEIYVGVDFRNVSKSAECERVLANPLKIVVLFEASRRFYRGSRLRVLRYHGSFWRYRQQCQCDDGQGRFDEIPSSITATLTSLPSWCTSSMCSLPYDP